MPMDALRTPEDRFHVVPDFPWASTYFDDLLGVEGLRVATLDEGPKDAEQTYLCLHGEPTWSYLYRRMIPVFLESGGRVVAPDFLGFGRSDKPIRDADYSVELHRKTVLALLDRLRLSNITLVCQDWGGLIGLTLPLDSPADRFSRLLIMNTAFPTGEGLKEGFVSWRSFVRGQPDLEVGKLMRRAVPRMTEAEAAAYEAPFPSAEYKAGVRTFPELVPTAPEHPVAELGRRAVEFWSMQWRGQSFMAVGAKDPVLGPDVMAWVRRQIRGCPKPLILEQAGHFVQEHGEEVARAALATFGERRPLG